MTPVCSLGITKTQLLDLHDNALPAAEAARLRDHMPMCAACTTFLRALAADGSILRAQPLRGTIGSRQMQDRLWRDLHTQIAQPRAKWSLLHLPRVAALRSGGVIAAAVVLIVLFAQIAHVLHNGDNGAAGILTPSQAWGTKALKTITTSSPFIPEYVSPDGATLIGDSPPVTSDAGDAIARLTVSSGYLQRLYTLKAAEHLMSLVADGRYVAWSASTLSGATHAPQFTYTLMTLDTLTNQVQTIAAKTDPSGINDYPLQLDHGMLFWEDFAASGAGSGIITGALKMTNLATGAITVVSAAVAITANERAAFSGKTFQVSWPYVIFSANGGQSGIHEHIDNVATGSDAALPVVPTAILQSRTDLYQQYTLIGATVIRASWTPPNGTQRFVKLDHADTAVATWQALTFVTQPSAGAYAGLSFAANNRLLVWTVANTPTGGATLRAWDRQQRHLIQLSDISPANNPGSELLFTMSGTWLAYLDSAFDRSVSVQSSNASTITLIDTTQLPAHPPS